MAMLDRSTDGANRWLGQSNDDGENDSANGQRPVNLPHEHDSRG